MKKKEQTAKRSLRNGVVQIIIDYLRTEVA